MKVALDVQYGTRTAAGAAVGFSDWEDPAPAFESAVIVDGVQDYEPGSFFRRELPVLRAVLGDLSAAPSLVVVDGYVWLGPDRPGLGWYVHDALDARIPVVGVAKNAFAGGTHAERVVRGKSARPLFVTSIGIDPAEAADSVRRMAGAHRIPTLLKRVDSVARERLLGAAKPAGE